MDRWTDGQMDKWTERWINKRIVEQSDSWTDRKRFLPVKFKNRSTHQGSRRQAGWRQAGKAGSKPTDRLIDDKRTDWTDAWTDRQKAGLTEEQIDRQIELRTY